MIVKVDMMYLVAWLRFVVCLKLLEFLQFTCENLRNFGIWRISKLESVVIFGVNLVG
jgi:hypothetical protein